MSFISNYSDPIVYACLLFVPAAALFTLPFMVFQYRRYGSIPILRVLVVYSFILYMMCAFLLTVLPLPDRNAVEHMVSPGVQLVPFSTYADAFRTAGFRLSDAATFANPDNWKALLVSGGLFEILANIVMQIPLGIYLTYYFRRTWKQVIIIGFLVSLFYEVTQLTGLWFMYPRAYRLFSADDLFDNTLGCLIGYAITPLFSLLLPSRDELDRISIARERKATIMRRVCAAIIDWLIWLSALTLIFFCTNDHTSRFLFVACSAYAVWILVLALAL